MDYLIALPWEQYLNDNSHIGIPIFLLLHQQLNVQSSALQFPSKS